MIEIDVSIYESAEYAWCAWKYPEWILSVDIKVYMAFWWPLLWLFFTIFLGHCLTPSVGIEGYFGAKNGVVSLLLDWKLPGFLCA